MTKKQIEKRLEVIKRQLHEYLLRIQRDQLAVHDLVTERRRLERAEELLGSVPD